MVLSPAPPRQTGRSVFPNTAFQSSSPRGFRFRLAFWHSFHRSSRSIWSLFGVYSVAAISFPLLLKKRDEGIAPSLSQGYAVLRIQAVIWANPTPLPTLQNFVSLYLPVALLKGIDKGLPCSLSYGCPCVSPLLPRKPIYRLW